MAAFSFGTWWPWQLLCSAFSVAARRYLAGLLLHRSLGCREGFRPGWPRAALVASCGVVMAAPGQVAASVAVSLAAQSPGDRQAGRAREHVHNPDLLALDLLQLGWRDGFGG